MATERSWRAMGTTAHVVVVGAPVDALDAAVLRLARLESRWTRFRDDSELAQLSAAAGAPVALSADTMDVLALALEAWRVTDGLFDPTLLDEVVAAGYDRPWPLAAAGRGAASVVDDHEVGTRPSPGELLLVPEVGVAIAPAGLHLDLGAIGKGRAADLLLADLLDAGVTGAVVNVGGDLAVAGVDEDGEPWTVDVEDPATERPRWRLQLGAGGLATSGVQRRRWRGPSAGHHVIDPRSGRPTDGALTAVTVAAGTAAWAEALATAALVAGPGRAAALLERTGVAGLLIDRDGTSTAVGGWDDLVVGPSPGWDDPSAPATDPVVVGAEER